MQVIACENMINTICGMGTMYPDRFQLHEPWLGKTKEEKAATVAVVSSLNEKGIDGETELLTNWDAFIKEIAAMKSTCKEIRRTVLTFC